MLRADGAGIGNAGKSPEGVRLREVLRELDDALFRRAFIIPDLSTATGVHQDTFYQRLYRYKLRQL